MSDKLTHCMCGCIYEEHECPYCNKVTDKDRIEELEKWKRYWSGEIDTILAGRADAEDRIEELEAKLAKAVAGMTALTDVSTLMQSSASHNRFRHNTIVTDSIWSQWSTQLKFARTTLTEMKG